MDNETNFKTVMATIATVYDKNLSPELLNIYWSSLSGYKACYLANALKLHIDDPVEGRFCPKPAHLIAHILPMQDSEKRSLEFDKQIGHRIERKETTAEDRSRISEMLRELKNEI
jgi:hypothetical protein